MLLSNVIALVGFGLLAVTQLEPPTLEVDTNIARAVTPGSIYLAPNTVPLAGPYVFSLTGATLFSGAGKLGPSGGAVYNFKSCSYNKTGHFCLWKGAFTSGYGNGDALVLNERLQIEKAVSSVDFHEFNIKQTLDLATKRVTDTALLTVYTPVRRDLSDYGVPFEDDQGWVIDCHLRAVDLGSGRVVFDWSSLDHVPLNESYVLPTGSINGYTERFAWDYFHLSSIDRLSSGDYIVSSRHTSTVYCISGKDGSIVWRLGGKASTFRLKDFKFSSQNDVRVVKDDGNILTLSMFDNAYNTFTPPERDSTGKIIELNIGKKTACLVQQYNPPQAGFQSGDGGSLMILPKGNVFIGWGSIPYVSEYTAKGRLVYSAHFGVIGSSASSYRAFKGPFTGIAPVTANASQLVPEAG